MAKASASKTRNVQGDQSSPAHRLLRLLKSGGDIRSAKVRLLRAQVRASRYENDLKLSVAIDRLLRELRHHDE